MRRGCFVQAEAYFRKALERLTERNPNPYNSETYYLLGLNLLYQGRDKDAYDAFFKATWSNEQQGMSFDYLSAISTKEGKYSRVLAHAEKSLVKNAHDIKARGLKLYLLRKLGRRLRRNGEQKIWNWIHLTLFPAMKKFCWTVKVLMPVPN